MKGIGIFPVAADKILTLNLLAGFVLVGEGGGTFTVIEHRSLKRAVSGSAEHVIIKGLSITVHGQVGLFFFPSLAVEVSIFFSSRLQKIL